MYPVIISPLFPLQVLPAICENHLSPLISPESWRIFTKLQQIIYIYMYVCMYVCMYFFFLLPSAFISFFLRTTQFNPHLVILDSPQREFGIVVMVWVKHISFWLAETVNDYLERKTQNSKHKTWLLSCKIWEKETPSIYQSMIAAWTKISISNSIICYINITWSYSFT